MTSLLARWLFAVTLLRICIFCITKQIETSVTGHQWKLFPLSLGTITLRLWRWVIFPKHRGKNFQ